MRRHCRFPPRRISHPLTTLVLSGLVAALVGLLAPSVAGAQSSDEFNSPALDTARWSFVDPNGSSSVSMTGSQAAISLGAGIGHDLWNGANTAPRLLQTAADADVEVEVKFDSAVDQPYEAQGLLIEQDADDLLRVDVYHDGSGTRLFAASMVGGVSTVEHQSTVQGGAPAFLRLRREGNEWTLRHSRDGVNWSAAATFTHAMTVGRIGPFASNGSVFPPAFVSQVDYFRLIVPDTAPPQLSAIAADPRGLEAAVTWTTNEPASSQIVFGTDTGYGRSATASGLGTSHALTLQRLACGTTYHYEIRSTDAAGNEARSGDRTLTTNACPTSASSDEFGGAAVDRERWSFVDALGGASLSATGTQAAIALPAGSSRDLWTGALNAPRLLQAAPDTDFEVEVKFDSVVDQAYEAQGLVVEQDADDLLRVDVYYDGSTTKLFAATVAGGTATVRHQSTVPGGAPLRLGLKRTGNGWSLRHAVEGGDWSQAATFTHAMTVRAAGPFAANGASSPAAFTALIDHFRVVAADLTAPTLSGISVAKPALGAEFTWTTNEPASSEVVYGPTSSYGSQAGTAATVQSHQLAVNRLSCGTTYHYELRSTDASGNVGSSGDRTFTTAACPGGLTSDEFNTATLNTGLWSFVDPKGDSQLTLDGSRALIGVPAASAHDLWGGAGNNTAPRLLQAAPGGNFEVEVEFGSAPTEAFQMQGLVVEQDLDDLLRVGVHRDGAGIRLFIASMVNGTATTIHDSALPGGSPPFLRLKRSGDTWTVKHSTDGDDWTTGAVFTHAMTVRTIGPFAGNGGLMPSGYTAAVDHFRVIPPDLTPPVISQIAAAPTPISAQVSWRTDERSTSVALYGLTTSYGQTVSRADNVRDHTVTVHGLKCATTYHYRVRSVDEFGNVATSPDQTLTTSACPTSLTSDEFAGSQLNTGLWTFVDPLGDSQLAMADGRAVVSVPAGVGHDMWTAANNAPRLLQAAPDQDFEIEVRFTSAPTAQYQMQGIVVAQDSNDLLRIEAHHDGIRTRLFVAALEDGVASVKHVSTIPDGGPVHLRLRRAGNDWRLRHSQDGDEWSAAVRWSHTLAVTAVGAFAGNNGMYPPAFAAAVDYFRVIPPDVTPPVLSGIGSDPKAITANVNWTTDEPTTADVAYGPTASYDQLVSDANLRRTHSVRLRGLACGQTYHYQVRSADEMGNETRSSDRTLTTAACPVSIRNDEFNATALDTDLWTVVDPSGDATIEQTGGRARLSVPGGVAHELWSGVDSVPRLLQPVPAGDFEVEVKFDSTVQERYQQQGLVLEHDKDDLLRVEAHHDGTATRLFIAAIENGVAKTKHLSTIAGGAPLYLRLKRAGTRWELRHSRDGSDWTLATRFTYAFEPTSIGPFAGNTGTTPPAFTAVVDHFRLVPPPPPDVTAPTISAPAAQARTYSALVRWTTSEHATTRLDIGRTPSYELPSVTVPGYVLKHTVELGDLACGATYHFRARSSDEAGNAAPSAQGQFTTAACPASGAPVIDVWNGTSQRVGHLGQGQRWFNVMGNVADPNGVLYLDQSLNGSPRRQVQITTSNLRIAQPGDFNLEIDVNDLHPGANQLDLIAQDGQGNQSTVTVTIERTTGVTTPMPHDVNWASATKVTDVAQVVDGRWEIDGGAARTAALGYDRILNIGDASWQDYEVLAPITIHSLSSTTLHSGAGMGINWNGHDGTDRPRIDWPIGAVCFYYRDQYDDPFVQWMLRWQIPHFVANDGRDNTLELGRTYNWRFRSQRLASDPTKARYSCKRWPADKPEPSDWDVSVQLPSERGSLILIADHADVSFGNLAIRPLSPAG